MLQPDRRAGLLRLASGVSSAMWFGGGGGGVPGVSARLVMQARRVDRVGRLNGVSVPCEFVPLQAL